MFAIIKFGSYIAKLRKSADMTQSELADKINITRQTISKYERGESFPDISILTMIADAFGVSVDNLINGGGPTRAESEILLNRPSPRAVNMDEIVNIAPFLKPSLLDRLISPLKEYGVDISHIIDLSEYINDETMNDLAGNANIDGADPELLEKFIPLLSEQSKMNIFENIMDGKIDYHLIDVLIPHLEYIRPLVEAAILEGAFSQDK